MPDRSGGSRSTASRFARWRSGWRVAIRIAQRDARRYKWRSALIVAMVGLPVLLLTSGITLMATSKISLAESVPRVMGSSQARVSVGGEPGRQSQSPSGQSFTQGGDGPAAADVALAVPGFAPDSRWTTSKVQKLTGGRVIPTLNADMRVILGDRRPRMTVLGIDGRDPLVRGMTELVSGRWASTSSEVVVTEAGIQGGLPHKGTVTTTDTDGKTLQLTVVGVATGHVEFRLPFIIAMPDLVARVSDQTGQTPAFLVERTEPVTWSDVRALNDQLRRYVLGQAVVLGVLSATLAMIAGVLLALGGISWWQAGHADFDVGPFEVSWFRVLGVFVCAVTASVVAALLPAKGIGRLDIVSVLAGRAPDRSVRRGLPVAGVAVLTALSIGAGSGIQAQENTYTPQGPIGRGTITLEVEDGSEQNVRAVVEQFAPDLVIDPVA